MTPAELLRARIKQSGLSATAFARDVLFRNPRTIRRWLSGESPIPRAVLDFLQRGPGERALSGEAA